MTATTVRRTRHPSAAVTAKARRLLRDGRVRILQRTPARDVLEVTGDHGVYVVVRDGGELRCPCRSSRPCSHALSAAIATGRLPS